MVGDSKRRMKMIEEVWKPDDPMEEGAEWEKQLIDMIGASKG